MKKFLLQFFTWWNGATLYTRFHTWRHGAEVGTDEFGNTYYRAQGHRTMPLDGPHAVSVPGEVAAWEVIHAG